MVRTFQLTKALGRMTVLDNMLLAGRDQTGESALRSLVKPLWRDEETANIERAHELLKRFHPDTNSGDRSAEAKLQRVIKAWKTLKKAGLA